MCSTYFGIQTESFSCKSNNYILSNYEAFNHIGLLLYCRMIWFINKFMHLQYLIQPFLVRKASHNVFVSKSSWEGRFILIELMSINVLILFPFIPLDISSWHLNSTKMLNSLKTTVDYFWFAWKWKDGPLEKPRFSWNITTLNIYLGNCSFHMNHCSQSKQLNFWQVVWDSSEENCQSAINDARIFGQTECCIQIEGFPARVR